MITLQQFRQQNPKYADMDSMELAENIYKANPNLSNSGVSFDDFSQHVGLNDDIAATRSGFKDTISAISEGIRTIPGQLKASGAAAIQGGDVPARDESGIDSSISENDIAIQDYLKKHGKNTGDSFLGVTPANVAEAISNIGFSGASMATGLGAGAIGAMTPVPGAGYASGMAATGKTAYNMSRNQITRAFRDAINEERVSSGGSPMNDDEWANVKSKFDEKAHEYGLWEAIPEAIGSAVGFKVLTAPLESLVGKKLAGNILGRIATGAGRFAAATGEELATETITQKGQGKIEYDVGLRDKPPTTRQAFNEIYGATVALSGIMGAGAIGAKKAYTRYVGKDQPSDLLGQDEQTTQQQVQEQQADQPTQQPVQTQEPAGTPLQRSNQEIINQQMPGERYQASEQMSTPLQRQNQAVIDEQFADEQQAQPEQIKTEQPQEISGINIPALRKYIAQHEQETAIDVKPSQIPDRSVQPEIAGFKRQRAMSPIASQPKQKSVKPRMDFKKQEIIPEPVQDKPERLPNVYYEHEKPVYDLGDALNRPPEPNQRPKKVQPVIPSQPKPVGVKPDMETFKKATITRKLDVKPSRPKDVSVKPDMEFKQITKVDIDANEAASSPENNRPEPTVSQAKAGNYKMGHPKIDGLKISIENPQGSIRKDKENEPPTWEQELKDHYGYLPGVEGADKDYLDVFVKPGTETSPNVFVVDQIDPKTGKFDENKVMIGYNSRLEAASAYNRNYEKGWNGGANITEMSIDDFKKWAFDGKKKNKPLGKIKEPVLTKQQKALNNYNDYVGTLSEAQKEYAGDLIETEPKAPSGQVMKIKNKLKKFVEPKNETKNAEEIRKDERPIQEGRIERQGKQEKGGENLQQSVEEMTTASYKKEQIETKTDLPRSENNKKDVKNKKGEVPKYSTKIGTGQISEKDIRSAFKGQTVTKDKVNPNKYHIETKTGLGFTVETVDQVSEGKYLMSTESGETRNGEMISGKNKNRNIEIVKGLGDKITLNHELVHMLEDVGLLTESDMSVIDKKIISKYKNGKFKKTKQDYEDRANFLSEYLAKREQYRDTTFGNILQKIGDFIDRLVNLFVTTTKGIARDVESGKIYDKKVDTRNTSDKSKLMTSKNGKGDITTVKSSDKLDDWLITTPEEYNEYVYGTKSNAFPKEKFPNLNVKERKKKLYSEFLQWQVDQGENYFNALPIEDKIFFLSSYEQKKRDDAYKITKHLEKKYGKDERGGFKVGLWKDDAKYSIMNSMYDSASKMREQRIKLEKKLYDTNPIRIKRKNIFLKQVKDIISAEDYNFYGVRVNSDNPKTGKPPKIKVGNIATPSFYQPDGEITNQRHGTSAIQIKSIDTIEKALLDLEIYQENGKEIVLIGSDDAISGNDLNEIEMDRPRILAIYNDDVPPTNQSSAPEKGARYSTVKTHKQLENKFNEKKSRLSKEFDGFMAWVVDKNRPIASIQEKLNNVGEKVDVFMSETQRPKITAAKVQNFWEDSVKPLIEQIAKDGYSVGEVEAYAHAKHSPEANEYLKYANSKRYLNSLMDLLGDEDVKSIKKKVNAEKTDKGVSPKSYNKILEDAFDEFSDNENVMSLKEKWSDFSSRASGMTNKESEEILKQYEGDQKIENIRVMIHDINSDRLELLNDAGLLPKETYESIKSNYKYYIPLMREGYNDTLFGVTRGLNPTKSIKIRGGSTRKVVDILANTISNYEKSINQAEKAESTRALRDLVKSNPDPDLWTLKKEKKSPRYDDAGNLVLYPDMFNVADNEFRFMVGGEQHILSVDRDNHNAMMMIRTLKAADSQTGPIINAFSRINRVLAAVNTSWSPEFIISNMVRDFQTAGINIKNTDVKSKNMMSGTKKAIAAIARSEFGKQKGTEYEKLYERFKLAGGKISWADVHQSVSKLTKKITSEIEEQQGKRPIKRTLKEWVGAVEKLNTSVENGVRLHAFKLAVDQGMSDKKAAQIASDLTVDFTKKGYAGPVINSLYLFANAGIQGSYRILRAAFTGKNKKAVQIHLAKVVGIGFTIGMFNALVGGDDEDGESYYNKIEPYIKERNLVIMIPGTEGKYAKIPLPWGYNLFWNIGGEMASAATQKNYNPIEGAMRLAGTFANAFNPVQSGTLLQTLAPTVADPFVQVAENKNWFGGPLMPEKNLFEKVPTPDSQRYWKSARVGSIAIAKQLNSLTGGDKIKKGAWDVSPETLDLVIDTIGGSALRFFTDSFEIPVRALRDEKTDIYKYPFIRRVYGEKSDYSDSQTYYGHREEILTVEEQLKAYNGTDYYEKVLSDQKDIARLILPIRIAENQLRKLRKMKREYMANGLDTKPIEDRIKSIQVNFNKLYNEKIK